MAKNIYEGLPKRNSVRIGRILHKLEKLWEKVPDQRLCQLISNLTQSKTDPYYVEDDLLENAIDNELLKYGITQYTEEIQFLQAEKKSLETMIDHLDGDQVICRAGLQSRLNETKAKLEILLLK